MKIKDEVADILADSRMEGCKLYLPGKQLERKMYVDVNKVLVAIGGKWNRKEKAHLFSEEPEDIVEQILASGEYVDKKKEMQFFETPIELAHQLVDMANIRDEETVLEPSAGRGNIAHQIVNCDCIEFDKENREALINDGLNVVGEDFLEFNEEYDVIVANPPFTKQQDIAHVTHMLKLAKRCVVSVMSSSVTFRTNKKTEEFKELIESLGGSIDLLPDDSFASSGTKVRTCVVYVNKADR